MAYVRDPKRPHREFDPISEDRGVSVKRADAFWWLEVVYSITFVVYNEPDATR